MKKKLNFSSFKGFISIFLIVSIIISSMPLSNTPIFAGESMQKGRFLVVYEKGRKQEVRYSVRSVFGSEVEKTKNNIKNGEIISEGNENIVLVKDSKMGISSTFREDKIIVIEEDQIVSLLDDEKSKNLENNKNNEHNPKEQEEQSKLSENINNTNQEIDNNSNHEEIHNTQDTENKKDEIHVKNTENNKNEGLKLEESNGNAENNFTEENQEVLAEEKEEIKNSLDKYIIDAKGENIKIALIDSGVNTAGTGIEIEGGKSFIDDSYDVDENGHGTSLAGIIKGYQLSDGTKFAGLAPNAELYSLKVLGKNGKGYTSDVIKALDWTRENNIDVVIMSFGADEYSSILHRSIQKCYFQDMLLVSASGNKNSKVKYPAAYTEVMAVGSSFEDKEIIYSYENKELVEIYAEGKKVETINSKSEPISRKGSSYSATIVASVGASLWSKNRTLNAREIRGLIKKASKELNDEETYKVLDAKNAEILEDNGEIPVEKDYDSEIKDKIDNDVEVSALADISYPPLDAKMWDDFKVGVKFSHSHRKVVAKLMLLENREAKELDSVSVSNISGGYDKISQEYTGEEYDFNFKATHKRGIYYIEFFPYDENGNLQEDWTFESSKFNVYGSNLQIANLKNKGTANLETGEMIDPVSKKTVKIVEGYEIEVDALNLDEELATDYIGEVKINFYLIPNNKKNVEIDESLTKLPDQYKEGSEVNGGKVIQLDDVDMSELLSDLKPSKKYKKVKGRWNPVSKKILTDSEFNETKGNLTKKSMSYKLVCELVYDKTYDDIVQMEKVSGTEEINGKSGHILTLKENLTLDFIITKTGEVHIVVDGDPVDMATGSYTSSVTDMAIAGKTPIEFIRNYNGTNLKDSGLGIHNSANYNMHYEDREDYIKVYFNDGHVEFYSKNSDDSYNAIDKDIRFVGYKNGTFVIEYKGNKTYTFNNTDDNHYINLHSFW